MSIFSRIFGGPAPTGDRKSGADSEGIVIKGHKWGVKTKWRIYLRTPVGDHECGTKEVFNCDELAQEALATANERCIPFLGVELPQIPPDVKVEFLAEIGKAEAQLRTATGADRLQLLYNLARWHQYGIHDGKKALAYFYRLAKAADELEDSLPDEVADYRKRYDEYVPVLGFEYGPVIVQVDGAWLVVSPQKRRPSICDTEGQARSLLNVLSGTPPASKARERLTVSCPANLVDAVLAILRADSTGDSEVNVKQDNDSGATVKAIVESSRVQELLPKLRALAPKGTMGITGEDL
jgi:hypothetical protein